METIWHSCCMLMHILKPDWLISCSRNYTKTIRLFALYLPVRKSRLSAPEVATSTIQSVLDCSLARKIAHFLIVTLTYIYWPSFVVATLTFRIYGAPNRTSTNKVLDGLKTTYKTTYNSSKTTYQSL